MERKTRFEVPLPTDSTEVSAKDLRGLWFYQPKLDGARTVTMLPAHKGCVQLFSSTGKELTSFEIIRVVLQSYNNRRNGDQTIYLDGKVVSIVKGRCDPKAIRRVLTSKDGHEVGELNYFIVDAATEDEWKTPTLSYDTRLGVATAMALELNAEFSRRIRPIPVDICKNPNLKDLRLVCEKFVVQGFQGVVLRRADCPVENRRSKSLLHVRPIEHSKAIAGGQVDGGGKVGGGHKTASKKSDKQLHLFELD